MNYEEKKKTANRIEENLKAMAVLLDPGKPYVPKKLPNFSDKDRRIAAHNLLWDTVTLLGYNPELFVDKAKSESDNPSLQKAVLSSQMLTVTQEVLNKIKKRGL